MAPGHKSKYSTNKTNNRSVPRPKSTVSVSGIPANPPVGTKSEASDLTTKPALSEFLAVPPLTIAPFSADEAQEEARVAVRAVDTIFIAPTGYGKSWVAYEAARDVLEAGGRVFYTAPLKALSNQKYVDLVARFDRKRVGILTGDRRENPGADIVVLTTEILRAMLLAGDTLVPVAHPCLIVLDECHWLADPERGTTWEELIILAPRSARLLLLSASVGNGEQVIGWLETVRGHSPRLLTVDTRAVPQRWGVWHDDRILPLTEALATKRTSGSSPVWSRVTAALKRDGLSPALVFLPTRKNCDAVADQCASVDGLVVRSHHAGRTLSDRLQIERDLQDGTIDVVFCTTTLASGIDAPVKSVVIGSIYDGKGLPLPPTVVQQMAGRAGRRGRDAVGFVIVMVPNVRALEAIEAYRTLPPLGIESAFDASYQTVLQLIAQRGLSDSLAFASRSFAAYQNRELIAEYRERGTSCRSELGDLLANLEPRNCVDPAETWPQFVQAELAFAGSRSPRDLERLRNGYLSVFGIAFARQAKKDSRMLILTTDGTLLEWDHAPPPLPVVERVDREVNDIVRSLLDAPADEPTVGSWFAFGTPEGGRSVQRVVEIHGDRVSFGGEGSYLRSRLTGKRVHRLDPSRFGTRVADLLADATTTPAQSASDGAPRLDSFPCWSCPALSRCPSLYKSISTMRLSQMVNQTELEKVDPEARVARTAGTLRRLGALDDHNRLTRLGRALLATHDRSGLFFAMALPGLATLSPDRLALVVAATRDIRVGYFPCKTDLLPTFFASEITRTAKAEIDAGGSGILDVLVGEAYRHQDDGYPTVTDAIRAMTLNRGLIDETEEGDLDGEIEDESVDIGGRPSHADRRAHIMKLLWSGRPVDSVGIASGDAERLYRDTLAMLNDLREVPELSASALAGIQHLLSIADRVLG